MDGISTILGQGAPSFRKRFSGNVLPISSNAPIIIVVYLDVVARLATESTSVRVVGAAQWSCADRDQSRPEVTFHRLPDHKYLGEDVADSIKPQD